MIPKLKHEGPSQAQVFFEAIQGFEVGEEFSYEKLRSITGFDVKGRNRPLIYRANKILLQKQSVMLKNIRGVGYKLATPEEQLKSAGFRRVRAGRQAKKGQMEAVNLDTSSMTDEQKKQQVFLINHLSTMLSVSRKRSLVSLEQTREAKKHIQSAEDMQKEALRQIDNMQKQINNLTSRLQ